MTTSARGSLAVAVAAVFGLAAALAACSSTPGGAYPIYKPTGDAAATPPPGSTSTTPGGNPDVNLGMPSGNVVVKILSPQNAGNPLGTDAPVDVSAEVTIAMGTDVVDPQTVRATITAVGTTMPLATVPLVGPTGAMQDQYVGKVPLLNLPSGSYTITVTAKSSGNQTGSSSVMVTVDAGPSITVISPVAGQHYKGSLVVLVAIDASGAPPVQNIQAQIGAMPVSLKQTDTPGLYRAVFDLTLPIPLSGDQLFDISAEDGNKLRAELKVTFDVDTQGPTITGTTPPPGTIVGGLVTLGATITDDAGVNESTLQVLIGDEKTPIFRLPLRNDGGSHYSALFDTNNLTKCGLTGGICIVRPTISFRGADNLGNETVVAYEIAVDNIPPIADLQPPKIRTWKIDDGYHCSTAFDPLDKKKAFIGDAPNDLCGVPQLFDLRARIEDDSNDASGLKQGPISLVDPDKTNAYILDAVTVNGVEQPLVVDTDGDGFCDDVNPNLVPTTEPLTGPKQVLKVRLGPVAAGGGADYYLPDYTGETEPMPAFCGVGQDTDPPLDLCAPGPNPTIAITYGPHQPAIWAIEPITPPDGGYCFGAQLDTKANNILPPPSATQLAAGWKCMAIVTSDLVGNRSTSAPIRFYLPDYSNGGSAAYCPPAPTGAGPPPTCTGTYDRTTGIVSAKACQTRNFKVAPGTIETCFEGNCD